MKITIFSGGSGSSQLVKGLRKISPYNKITHIINMYDDGKSTGICRKIADTLGPSDMRKVHFLHYMQKDPREINKDIVKFYKERYDFPNDESKIDETRNKILEIISSFDFEEDLINLFVILARNFFELAKERKIYDFRDFSIANIIYSMIMSYVGIEKTNRFFIEDFLKIKNFDLLVNSHKNYVLGASCHELAGPGFQLFDEASIVSLDDPMLIIDRPFFIDRYGKKYEYEELNPNVIKELDETDLIILSSGTQMSSLIPTYMNKDIQECLEKNSRKIIMVMNTKDDKDMRGCTAEEILEKIPHFIRGAKILVNSDASYLMNINGFKHPERYDIKIYPMGNEDGKHNDILLAKAIFSEYFEVNLFNKKYDKLYLDFDDTVYPRKNDDHMGEQILSIIREFVPGENKSEECHTNKGVVILSGNGISAISNAVVSISFANNIFMNIPVWANSCSVRYIKKYCFEGFEYADKLIEKNVFSKKEIDFIQYLAKFMNAKGDFYSIEKREEPYVSCINIKPKDKEHFQDIRHIIVPYFNMILGKTKYPIICREVGTTSIEFVRIGSNKVDALNAEENSEKNSILFIGDEKDGNDRSLFDLNRRDFYTAQVKSVYDTYTILKCLMS